MIAQLCALAREAGRKILATYGASLAVEHKADQSPLTVADHTSHALICEGLHALTPTIPILSEESDPSVFSAATNWSTFWLVDPLDGTKEFLKKTGAFTVNIALIEAGFPVVGVVGVPATGAVYFAEEGKGAFYQKGADLRRIQTRRADLGALCLLASRDHAGPLVAHLLDQLPQATCISMGSALKFCIMAAGEADVYLRDRPTMLWDTAASQCILEAAGGQITDLQGQRLAYRTNLLQNPAFIALGDPDLPWTSWLP